MIRKNSIKWLTIPAGCLLFIEVDVIVPGLQEPI